MLNRCIIKIKILTSINSFLLELNDFKSYGKKLFYLFLSKLYKKARTILLQFQNARTYATIFAYAHAGYCLLVCIHIFSLPNSTKSLLSSDIFQNYPASELFIHRTTPIIKDLIVILYTISSCQIDGIGSKKNWSHFSLMCQSIIILHR